MTLHPHHLKMLTEGSGIAEDIIATRGYETATTPGTLETLGFADFQRCVPALILPVHDVQGAPDQMTQDTCGKKFPPTSPYVLTGLYPQA